MKKQILRGLSAAVILAIAAAACSGDAVSPATMDVVGMWPLSTVGANTVPFAWDSEVILQGGSMELTEDGHFTETESWHHVELGTSPTTRSTGTYTRSGAALTFVFDHDHHTEQAALGSRTMTFHTASGDWVYRKE